MFGRIASFKCVLALFLLSSQFSFAAERQADTDYTREEVRRALDQAIKDNDKEAFHRASQSLTKFIIRDVLGIALNVFVLDFMLNWTENLIRSDVFNEREKFCSDPDELVHIASYAIGLSTGIMMAGAIPSLATKAITTARDCYARAKAIRPFIESPQKKNRACTQSKRRALILMRIKS